MAVLNFDIKSYANAHDLIPCIAPRLTWYALTCLCQRMPLCLSPHINNAPNVCINALRPRQNDRQFPCGIFKCIFFNENIWIFIKMSLKFIPKGPINSIPALVQIMAWRRSSDKPLFKRMMASLLMYICITRSQRVNAVNVTCILCFKWTGWSTAHLGKVDIFTFKRSVTYCRSAPMLSQHWFT